MASIFGPFFTVTPKPNVFDNFGDEVMGYALDNIARDLKTRLRSRLDTGVDLNAALRASRLKVQHEAGRITINTGDTGDEGEETTVQDLFQPTMEAPTVDSNKLVFRQIRAQELERKNVEVVREGMKEVMNLHFVDHVAEGVKRVSSKHPELLK